MSDNINNDAAPEGGMPPATAATCTPCTASCWRPSPSSGKPSCPARYDHYQQVGGAASPKIGLSLHAEQALLLRASAGRGFRAPSMTDLYRPTVYSSTATLPDPVYCATVDNNYADCADNWDTRRYSNPNLKPERSRQFSLGMVVEPAKHSMPARLLEHQAHQPDQRDRRRHHPRQPGQVRQPGAPRRRRLDRLHRTAQGKPRRPDRQGPGPDRLTCAASTLRSAASAAI
jgi:hypothetical protein